MCYSSCFVLLALYYSWSSWIKSLYLFLCISSCWKRPLLTVNSDAPSDFSWLVLLVKSCFSFNSSFAFFLYYCFFCVSPKVTTSIVLWPACPFLKQLLMCSWNMFMVINRLQVLAALSSTEELAAVPSCHSAVTYFECCRLDSLRTMKMFLHHRHKGDSSTVNWEMCVCVTTWSVNLLLALKTFPELFKNK